MPDKDKPKYRVRKLEELDAQGRVVCTHVDYDLGAMLIDAFPELREEYDKEQAKKKKGDVLPFPK
ncbi:MAG TPA: hypothetical protein DEF34_03380 [Desulfotomaculum sp.]|nr:MAG: hypothetical protein JL56_02990 [Desulfotomaculum sp. BICA1-6]HBX22670.1 hypothetical protein [Desulfotomaculum sp.]